ncbi:enoyl-CoA hydratase/isomerase family protein [Tahibacter amnicola]|uniref:Enoyl-CoA hydratase/isomerase family protein n=1 Tax=Tahibacter amnicola TaxID=2976241 RepID=A0ABY6BBL7_9GAMM|nr:enoyl-CoA hydratase/isomerase family protein [Tahibacter amnicola]UXI67089.1 enoyl-CoA hydratase/isomerase family protein [Tahibacter amnicola]
MSPSIVVSRRGHVAEIRLARPAVHNAFDEHLIAQLTEALAAVDGDPEIRIVVLTGEGASFSAGADLQWMRSMAGADEAENRADSQRLAALMRTLNYLSKPTIARVNGAAYGGGVGLIACCDIAVGVEGAKFSLSEVKLGLVPAVISPYVVAAIGARQARRWFVTGEVFDAAQAQRLGLLHEVVKPEALDEAVDRLVHWLGKGGPRAQAEAKALALRIGGMQSEEQQATDLENAALIARLRVSAEGQHGLSAFLEKRAPDWAKEN